MRGRYSTGRVRSDTAITSTERGNMSRPNSSKTTSRSRSRNSCGYLGRVEVGVVPRACEREGCDDESEHNAAADDRRCVELVVSFVAAGVALIGHGYQL